MTDLTVTIGSQVHKFNAPSDSSRTWGPLQWSPVAAGAPDAGCYMRRLFDIIEGEVEVGNTSIVPGQVGATKPAMGGSVTVTPGAGFDIIWDCPRIWPDWWPIGREAWRRFCLVPKSSSASVRGRAKELAAGMFGSTWPVNRLRYGPTDMPLPALSAGQLAAATQQDGARFNGLHSAIQVGNLFKLDDSEDGLILHVGHGWRPWGPADPGAPAGSGIYFSTGWRQNLWDLRIAVLAAQCEHERMLRYYRRDTGAPLSVDDYTGTSPDLWGARLPEVQGVPNFDPIPIPYDYAHEIRGSRRTIQLTEQLSSPMARRSLAGVAAVSRMRFSERGRLPQPGYIPVNFAALLQQAKAKPGTGIWGSSAGRQIGWGLFENAQCVKKNGLTPGKKAYSQAVSEFVKTAATPAGAFQRAWGAPFPETPGLWTMQTMEYSILAYGCVGLEIQAKTGTSTRDVFLKGLGQIYGPNTKVPIGNDYGGRGPMKFINTSDKDGVFSVLTSGQGTSPQTMGASTHALSALALAAHMDPTNRAAWLARMAVYDGPASAPGAQPNDGSAFAVAQLQKP